VNSDPTILSSSNVVYHEHQETAEIVFSDSIKVADEGTLSLTFTGILNDKMKGEICNPDMSALLTYLK
jgi:hypothetical protein